MKRFSQTIKVTLALFLAVFGNGLLPAAAVYATNNDTTNGTPQPVWCQFTNTWTAQQGSSGNNNQNRVPLTILPAGAPDEMYIEGGQVWTPNSSFDAMKDALDAACVSQETSVTATAPTVVPVCGPNNDLVTFAATSHVTYSQTGWAAGSNTVLATADTDYVLSGTSSWTLTDTGMEGCGSQPEPDVSIQTEEQKTCIDGVQTRTKTVTTPYVFDTNTYTWVLGTPEAPVYSEWTFSRGLTDTEKSELGCLEEKKVWVCKYVGTPGIDERLKQGNDGLVQVSVNAIQQNQWDGTIPGWFSDAHDRSYVIAYVDDKETPPSTDDCPMVEEPVVEVLDTVCIEDGQSGSFTVRVTNPNNYAITYLVEVDADSQATKTLAAGASADFTFSGYMAGTYTYTVYQQSSDEDKEALAFLSESNATPAVQWVFVASGEVTLENCGHVLGDTDVCPNIVGSQATVPTGYSLVNGQCIMPQVLAAATALPATIPATGANDTSNIYLILGVAFSALTYFIMLRRYQEEVA